MLLRPVHARLNGLAYTRRRDGTVRLTGPSLVLWHVRHGLAKHKAKVATRRHWRRVVRSRSA